MNDEAQVEVESLGPLRLTRAGVVEKYDADSGLGTVSDGSVRYPFHCTAIADGSRRIAVGTAVYYVLRLVALGRIEADELVPR